MRSPVKRHRRPGLLARPSAHKVLRMRPSSLERWCWLFAAAMVGASALDCGEPREAPVRPMEPVRRYPSRSQVSVGGGFEELGGGGQGGAGGTAGNGAGEGGRAASTSSGRGGAGGEPSAR